MTGSKLPAHLEIRYLEKGGALATMIVGSQQFFLDPDQVEPIKERVSQLVPGASISYGYTDSDGDNRWVFIPYGCPISITTWANER